MTLTEQEARTIRDAEFPSTPYCIDRAFLPVLYELEQHGCAFDPAGLDGFHQELQETMQVCEEHLRALSGNAEFNIRSVRQVHHLIFDQLRLARGHRAQDTKRETLLTLAHPAVESVLLYREAQKVDSTYLQNLVRNAAAHGGRVKTWYNNTLVETGRLSSGNSKRGGNLSVNLQNIPKSRALGARLRHNFVAAPGCALLRVDMSQAQLRIAAVDSNDEKMLQAFLSGEDYHTRTALDIMGDAKYRRIAKHLNFAMLFGASLPTVRATLLRMGGESTEKSITEAYNKFFLARPGLLRRILHARQAVRERGFLQDMFGRRAYYPVFEPELPTWKLDKISREAYNFLIQGPEASLAKLLSIMMYRAAQRENIDCRTVLMVHDEVVWETPVGGTERLQNLVRQTEDQLNGLLCWPIPLVLDSAVGANWGAME